MRHQHWRVFILYIAVFVVATESTTLFEYLGSEVLIMVAKGTGTAPGPPFANDLLNAAVNVTQLLGLCQLRKNM